MRYAEVAVNAPLAHSKTFTYSVPPDLPVDTGHAVWVPFGPRLLQGVVLSTSSQPAVDETKEISHLIDPHPLLSPERVALAKWIAEHYLASYFEAAALMLPPGFERRIHTLVQPASGLSADALAQLDSDQRRVMIMLDKKGRVGTDQLKRVWGRERAEAIVGQLVRKGLISRTYEIGKARVQPRLVTMVRLAVSPDRVDTLVQDMETKRAHQQARLLRLLLARPKPVALTEITRLGIPPAAVRALGRKGLVTLESAREHRDPLGGRVYPRRPPPRPTPAQEAAWSEIRAGLERMGSGIPSNGSGTSMFLLHGVTGSGKTEIYLRALEAATSLGKRGIVLVPEIALTPQTIARFAERFPNRVAVLHSKLSIGERFDQWQLIREGAYDVVIGSRGALFAPQPELGLIVMDEEHEWTYKQQEQQPRYHAKDVAFKLAQLAGCVLLLGSATPDVTSYYRARNGEFLLLQLPDRIGGGRTSPMPHVEIVDLRSELRQGNRSILSRALTRSITRALAEGEQVILFLNRRGTATIVQCRDCGHVVRCKRCDVSLTYHAAESRLLCHHCNQQCPVPDICPQCWSKRIKFLGAGTQKVQEEVARAFPGARLLRWDRDVTRGKASHEHILAKFLAHEADILIGTQMIAKGLDMPLVTVVGVVNADIGLYLPDFRSSERTFQILAQVAGRAGRGTLEGRVVIQSYTPEHYAVLAASKHDYASFYEQEIAFRHRQGYPPFRRLARLIYAHTNAKRCQEEAERLCQLITEERDRRGLADTEFIGPSPAFAQRVRGRYRWQIVVRSPDPLNLLSHLTLPQGWSVDIDPVSLA